ncbi:MAG: phage protease [Patescibacteria group bacterium]
MSKKKYIGGEVAGQVSQIMEVQIFPAGKVYFADRPNDPITVDSAGMDSCVAKFEAHGINIPFDYEHQTEGKRPDGSDFSSPDGTAPAAGWITRLINKGKEGLWAVVEWTDRAQAFLTAREYRYYSPVFYTDKAGRLVELARVALTNAPRLTRIKPLVAKDGTTAKENQMDLLKTLIALLGMPEESTEEDVAAAIKNLVDANAGDNAPPSEAAKETAKELAAVAKLVGAKPGELVATIAKIKMDAAGKTDLQARLEALETANKERAIDDLVGEAVAAGKVSPAMIASARKFASADPEAFGEWVAAQPRIVPAATLATDIGKPSPEGLTEEGKAIAKKIGLTDDDIAKYGPQAKAK